MVLLEYLFALLFLVIFPIGEIGRFSYKNINFTLIDFAVLLIILSWLFFMKKKKLKNTLILPLALFSGFSLLSSLTSLFFVPLPSFLIGFLYFVRWVAYALIFFVVITFEDKLKRRILIFMTLSGILIATVGYIQLFFYPSLLALYQFCWDEHLWRLASFFFDPNFTGIVLTLAFLLNFRFLENIKDKKLYFFIGIQIFILIAILLTYSRSAVISVLISSFCFLILEKKTKIAFLTVTSIAILLFIVSFFGQYSNLTKSFRTEGTNFFRTASADLRLQSAKYSLIIFEKNPIFGIGFNNYRYYQFKENFINKNNWQVTHAGSGTDNSFLFVLTTTGTIGLTLYLYLWFCIFKHLRKRNKPGRLPNIAVSSLIAIFVASMFNNAIFYPFVMLWMWILISISWSS